ncbi:hypothetical protein CC2G_001299 [Coprinopsis cinerea AmutBmut pab1-1]|nr:hypothetical protein CC2G_001299 [Coprinopsis cinerea AmutBmut pab1-1]
MSNLCPDLIDHLYSNIFTFQSLSPVFIGILPSNEAPTSVYLQAAPAIVPGVIFNINLRIYTRANEKPKEARNAGLLQREVPNGLLTLYTTIMET